MENLGKANIINALNLYDYLALYGFDKYHTKDDLIVLAMINDFLSNNCHYNILDDCLYRKLLCIVEKIMNGNPMMKYCRIFFTEYKNLDGSQNIRDYQKVKDETGIDYSIPAFKYTIDQSPPAQIPSQGGGVVLDGSPTGFYQVGKKIVIPTVVPIATGYTFDYWLRNDTGLPVSGSFVMPENDVTVEAQWIANSYTLTIDLNGGSPSSSPQGGTPDGVYAYGTVIELMNPDPVRTNYTFAGWIRLDTNENVTASFIMPASDLTLQAQWIENQKYLYKIDLSGGTGSSGGTDPGNYYEGTTISLPSVSPSKAEYNFTGWKRSDTNTAVSGSFVMPDNDVTIIAQWELIPKYAFSIDLNSGSGGLGGTVPGNYYAGTVIDLMTTNPSRTGYIFDGWIRLDTNQAVTGSFAMPANNIVLQAQWELAPVTVTFNGNGGVLQSGQEQVTVPYGTLWIDVAKPSYKRPQLASQQGGFTYIKDDDSTLVNDTDILTADITVYASFTVIEIGVITHDGEILSAQGWIEKYGVNLYSIYDSGSGNLRVFFKNDDDSLKDHLVEYIYFKDGDFAFGIACDHLDDGSSRNMLSGGTDFFNMQQVLTSPDSVLNGKAYQISAFINQQGIGIGGYNSGIYPRMLDPMMTFADALQFTQTGVNEAAVEAILNNKNGKQLTAEIIAVGQSTELTGMQTWAIDTPALQNEKFYVGTPYEYSILSKNLPRLWDLIDILDNWGSTAFPNPNVPGAYIPFEDPRQTPEPTYKQWIPYTYFAGSYAVGFYPGDGKVCSQGFQRIDRNQIIWSMNNFYTTSIPLVTGYVSNTQGNEDYANCNLIHMDILNNQLLDGEGKFERSNGGLGRAIPLIDVMALFLERGY